MILEERLIMLEHVYVEQYGRFYRVRTGERSAIPSLYTSRNRAEKVCKAYIEGIEKKRKKVGLKGKRVKSDAKKVKE